MENSEHSFSDASGSGVFAAAAQQFAQLLHFLSSVPADAAGFAQDLHRIRERLVAEVGGWLQSAHPFATAGFGTPGSFSPDLPRIQRLLRDWGLLQTQLAAHWNTIARVACEKFLGQITEPAASWGQRDARKLYNQWIDCAEGAYAETAHSEAFCNVISGLINTTAAFQLLGQEQAQAFARSVNLPTRAEFDALKEEVATLKRRMTRRSRPIRSRKASRSRKPRR